MRKTLLCVAMVVSASSASAQPAAPGRLVHVPTADLGPRLGLYAGGTHRQRARFGLAVALGNLAEVELDQADWLAICDACGTADGRSRGRPSRFAQLKIQLLEDGRLAPAIAVGFRRTVKPFGGDDRVTFEAADLFAVASKSFGPVRGHLGLEMWDARVGEDGEGEEIDGAGFRPLAGVAWTPSIYPKTTLVADLSWIPVDHDGRPELRWMAGWGIRYRALRWADVDLAVRHRESDALGDSTVLVGARLHWDRD